MNYKTEQENFWAGEFGDHYIIRNKSEKLIVSNIKLFSDIFDHTAGVKSVLELGANVGLNIRAINLLLTESETSAVEINKKAFDELQTVCTGTAILSSILDINIEKHVKKYDFVFTKGVLIHIKPDELPGVYERMYGLSDKYICLSEYYNPTPMTVTYRGEKNKLFKRDFAGELMDQYPDLKLIGYGFKYKRDNNFPQDDMTWFLLEKQ